MRYTCPWLSGKKVGKNTVREFLSVVVRDEQQGGILISTTGFSISAMQGITEIERRRLRLGDKEMIIFLCRTYLNVTSGLAEIHTRLANKPKRERRFANERYG